VSHSLPCPGPAGGWFGRNKRATASKGCVCECVNIDTPSPTRPQRPRPPPSLLFLENSLQGGQIDRQRRVFNDRDSDTRLEASIERGLGGNSEQVTPSDTKSKLSLPLSTCYLQSVRRRNRLSPDRSTEIAKSRENPPAVYPSTWIRS
jgi:hypothetical protein